MNSNAVISKIQSINNWKWLINYINKHPEHFELALENAHPVCFTSQLYDYLTSRLAQPREEKYEYEMVEMSVVPKSESNKEICLLNMDELIAKIQTINNWKWMYNYIKKHPEQLDLCMVWCSWEAFDVKLIVPLIEEGLLNVDKIAPEYNGSDAENISFRQHCYLLLNDEATTSVQRRKLQEIDDIVPRGIL